MRATRPGNSLTLAIYPTCRGFGWIAFEGPFAPYDWGIIDVAKNKNAVCLRRVERLLARLEPETLVLESFEGTNSTHRSRVAQLGQALVGVATARGIEVAVYTLHEVRACFGHRGAQTRVEIAEAVARTLPMLAHRLPSRRRPWNGEDRRTSLFSAAALVLAHYRYGVDGLFDTLRRPETQEGE